MIRAALFLLAVGAVLGFLLDRGKTGVEVSERVDRWESPVPPVDYQQSSDRFRQSLFDGGLFPAPISSQAVVAVDARAGESGVNRPSFPLVLSTARIDGAYQVQLRLPDGEIVSAGVGHELPGDWVVTEVSLNSVSAAQDGDAFTIDLSNQDVPS